jgi:hypothetical protein
MSSSTSASSQTQLPEEERQWSNTPPKDEESAPAENEKDPNLVDWEENDKDNPRNWSNGYKAWLTFQLAMLALAASMGSSIISPAENDISETVGVSSEVTVLCISLYM